MNCYNCDGESAVCSCKHCCKSLCKKCSQESGYGICCSEDCKAELLCVRDIMEKSKIMYGLKSGRIPVSMIMYFSFAVIFIGIGVFAWSSGSGIFPIIMGIIFLAMGIGTWINQRKSGLRV